MTLPTPVYGLFGLSDVGFEDEMILLLSCVCVFMGAFCVSVSMCVCVCICDTGWVV